MHIKHLHWIVVEDGNETYPAVENVLKRSKIKYSYLYADTPTEFEKKKSGWAQRNKALSYIRYHYWRYRRNAVVYFADDDNTYDLRLFNKFIRNVKTVGIWAVAFVGTALVETPVVKNGKIQAFNVIFNPSRTFATDMAGFAVNLKLIINSKASFHHLCKVYDSEDCFLKQLNITLDKVQPFGVAEHPREVLVWHTQTTHSGGNGSDYGYNVIA
uniref:Galactosylgalactosylxylosylprotein 3-beta-glucuronosyltransferase n=1 Tax=Panagrolaimus sp. ES5 TaxID=591445 RepID=A0AC34FAW7_9BILA